MSVLSFGEILWDVYPDKKYLGGAPLNFAVHYAGLGGSAYMVSAVGEDELGKLAMDKLKGWDINTEYVNMLPDIQTGRCNVKLDEKGIPRFELLRNVAYDFIDCRANGLKCDALYFGTLALRSLNNRDCLNKLIKNNNFREIYVDINIRPPFYSNEVIRFAFNNATIMKISDEELPVVMKTISAESCDSESSAPALAEAFSNLKIIIITRGEKGSVVYDCLNNKLFSLEAKRVKVVSTVGAGDSYSAAFLFNYLSGKSIRECAEKASELSAYVVSRMEAIPER